MSDRHTIDGIRTILLTLFAMLLSACTSIPLSTMWKLRSFSGNDLKALNPADIRLVLELPDSLKFEPDKTTLDVDLTPENAGEKELRERAKLMLVKQGRFVPADVPVAEQGQNLYLMKLDADGLKTFQDFQQRLDPDVEQHYKAVNFNASIQFANDTATGDTRFKTTVWLRMKRDQGYFALLKDVPFRFSRETKDHGATSASH